jgi:hypothetical protein
MSKKPGLIFYTLMIGSLLFGLQIALGTLPTCPIGTDGAPNLRDPGIASGGKCRGACGEDCPSDRCDPVAHIIIPVYDTSGLQYNCVYNNVVSCLTHQGCRDHDACYDRAATAGEKSLYGPLHLKCNQECFDTWGYFQCGAWSDLAGYVADYWIDPDFDATMLFSDPPKLLGPIGPMKTSSIKREAASEDNIKDDGLMYAYNAYRNVPFTPLTPSN